MEKVRVGLVVDGFTKPAWVKAMLELIAREEDIEIALVVKVTREPAASATSWLASKWMKLDSRLVGVSNDSFAPVDLAPMLAGVRTIDVIARGGSLAAGEIDRIRAERLAVLLKLSDLRADTGLRSAASCGVWWLEHGAHGRDVFADSLTLGDHDVISGSLSTETALVGAWDAHEPAMTLERSWAMTYPYSVRRNRSHAYWKTLSFAPRRLRELRDIGVSAFRSKYEIKNDTESTASRAIAPKEPGALDIAKLLSGAVFQKVARRKMMEQWIVLYRFGEDDIPPKHLAEYKQLVPPVDRFWADPFVIERNGEYALFIEELEYSRNLGHLSVIPFTREGEPVLPPVKIMEHPYHLSYPFLWEENSELYMIPETNENRKIDLYKCTRFPDRWEFVRTLIDNIIAVDATLFRHNGRIWLFCCVAENENASLSDELHIFHADDLFSPHWQPHALNPVITDVRRARPAGNIFESDGAWIRPAQDCSGKYGRAVSFQRIDVLTETDYVETPVSGILPDWDPQIDRIHTFNRAGALTVVDGMMNRGKSE